MTAQETIVDRLYNEFQALVAYLTQKGEISFQVTADDNFRKTLLLAAASYFENQICDDIIRFTEKVSSSNARLVEFVKNKAVSRQYHTFFSWDTRNANTFFGLFGESFRNSMADEIKNNSSLDDAIKAFIELGAERNRLVHENFGTFYLDKTVKEIYQLYKDAFLFVECIPRRLRSLT